MNQNSTSSSRPLGGASASTPGARPSKPLYERIEEIGTGGIGTVYLANQVKLGRQVALKEIREIFDVFAGVQRQDIVARFTEIVQAQAGLTHPNIIQIVDVDTDAEFPFVVMQYAPNGNLRRLIETEGRPPLQVALKYFLQILHALNTAHDNGITHGGIKPENVVLDLAGNALLTDFGISGVADLDSNKGNQVYVGVGTVAYMSPEQFRDPNTSTIKTDIYSLGIMFYEMLTGKVPGRRSPMPSSFYPDIPRKLDDVFDRMSMDDVRDRYDSIEEILADVYGSEEVMEILDKRGGFIFLRDPLRHGVSGMSGGGFGAAAGEASEADDSEASDLGEASSSVAELSEASEADEDSDFSEASEASDEDGGGDDDVLGKLDKYGELFGEEDGEERAEDEEDEEPVEA